MFAIVQDGTIVSFPKGNKGITLEDIQYPKLIISYWMKDKEKRIVVIEVL